MAITKTDFIEFANNRSTSPEFTLRNRISRAYYAVYHAANEYYEEDKEINTDYGHKELVNSLKESKSRQKSYIGFKLGNMKTLREWSDYFLNKNINKDDLKATLIDVDKILEELGFSK